MLDELDSIFKEYKPGKIIPLPRVKKILKQFKPLKHYFKFPKPTELLRRGRR